MTDIYDVISQGYCAGMSGAPPGPACIKMYYGFNMVYQKNGQPAFTPAETVPPDAFEFIPTEYRDEYLIRKYGEEIFLTYESSTQPSYVVYKSRSISDAMEDDAFHFKVLFDGSIIKNIQHVETGFFLTKAGFDSERSSGIMFRARTPDNKDHWMFKLDIVECEVGKPFVHNSNRDYDRIQFPKITVSQTSSLCRHVSCFTY